MSTQKLLQSLLQQRILVLDGAMGTMIQKHKIPIYVKVSQYQNCLIVIRRSNMKKIFIIALFAVSLSANAFWGNNNGPWSNGYNNNN
jgi:methionine synthase I (cobalamin-dependent)